MRLGNDIAERLLELAHVALRLASRLPKDPAGRHVASQLIRSATGGGANFEEARAADRRAGGRRIITRAAGATCA